MGLRSRVWDLELGVLGLGLRVWGGDYKRLHCAMEIECDVNWILDLVGEIPKLMTGMQNR